MIRKTCSFFLKLDSNDDRHRRYHRDARALASVRGFFQCSPIFGGTLRHPSRTNRHAARHTPGHLQQVRLHVDDLAFAVPSVREEVLQAVGVLPDRAVDQAVQVEAMVRSPIRYFVPRTAAPTGLSTAACCQGCFALVKASHRSGRLAVSPPTSHRQIRWAVAHRQRT